MQQSQLSFEAITAHDAAMQRIHCAQRYAEAHPSCGVLPSLPPKRPVGRPPCKRSVNLVVLPTPTAGHGEEKEEDGGERVSGARKKSRGQYTNWFSSPYISDILAAYERSGHSAKRTVKLLIASVPWDVDRYARLSHSSILSWFGADRKLLPRFQEQLDANAAAARGRGPDRAFAAAPQVEEDIKRVLLRMREAGVPLNCSIVRWVMQAVIEEKQPSMIASLTFSHSFVSNWARSQLQWRYRRRTTAASKLPSDWEDQGVQMAMRIAANMAQYKVHPSLIINMDQTGIHLVPSSSWTYERKGSDHVAVIGAEDKRQITACIASSMDGNFLPLQLVFQGKTSRCLPPHTPASLASLAHLTFSDNHWSSQTTMKEYIEKIIMPYSNRCIELHQLHADAKMILVLDVWAVHKSEEFRRFLRSQHPRIHLVFVPANCTSKLQVADVALQRPFKSQITNLFNEWAATQIKVQLQQDNVVGLNDKLRMSTIKPLALEWCIESYRGMKERKQLVLDGWQQCCLKLFNVMDPEKRAEALVAVVSKKLDQTWVPIEEEQDKNDSSGEEESDDEEDELDVSKPSAFGERKSGRMRTQAIPHGYQLASSAILMTEDSEA
jgi:DDE superfamily endonuclease